MARRSKARLPPEVLLPDSQAIGHKPVPPYKVEGNPTAREFALKQSERILAQYARDSHSTEEGAEHALSWLIASLAHYADFAKLDFNDVIEHARDYYHSDFDEEPRRKPRW